MSSGETDGHYKTKIPDSSGKSQIIGRGAVMHEHHVFTDMKNAELALLDYLSHKFRRLLSRSDE